MTAAWAAVAIAALALSGGALAAVIRLTVRWTRLELQVKQLLDAVREDRAATDRRVTWLERNMALRPGRRSPRNGV